MNAVPEWFTVEPDEAHRYRVEEVDGAVRVVSGKALSAGLPVRLAAGRPLRLLVQPAGPADGKPVSTAATR